MPKSNLPIVKVSEEKILEKIYLIRGQKVMQDRDLRVELIPDNKDLWMKIEKIEQHLMKNDEEIKTIFAYLKKLLIQETKPGNPIGFRASVKK